MTQHPRVALAVAVGLVLWGLITHGTYAGTGDDPHYKMIAHSIAFDGDFDLTDDYARQSHLIFGERADPEQHAIPGKDGRLRPVHDVGLPILASPWYRASFWLAEWAGRTLGPERLARVRLNQPLLLRHLVSFLVIGLTIWIALQVFEVFAATARRERAVRWATLIVLSPPILSHAYLFFTEVLSAALVLWVFLRLRRPAPGRADMALAGLITGYLLLIHARNAGLVIGLAALAVYRVWRMPERRLLLAWLAVGALPALALRTALTHHFWGAWVFTPHARLDTATALTGMTGEMAIRLLGLLADQEHGLLLHAPIYLLAPAGWMILRRRDRELTWQITWLIGVYLATIAVPILNPHGWRGGWSPAARFLVPVIPLIAWFVFAAVGSRRRLPVAIVALVLAQVLLDVLFWQQPKLTWEDGDGTSALLVFLDGGTGLLSGSVPSFEGPLTARMWAVLAAGAAVWLGLTVSISRGGAAELPETRPNET